jgi:hypothetical protein
MASSSDDLLLGRLMTLCRDVFADRHYEAAYHILNAAIHVGHDTENEDYLRSIAELAEEQADWINAHAPESIMSAQSAKERSGIDMYLVAIRQAKTHAAMIHEKHRRRDKPSATWRSE